MREVGGSGCWFPERGYILEYQKCRFAKMILHDRCSISYDLAASFRGRRSTLERWTRKIVKRIGTRVCAQHWSFHFWRKSRRSRSSLMLSTLSFADFFRDFFCVWSCQVKKWGSFVKGKQGRGREKRNLRREKNRSERVSRKKMQMREKVDSLKRRAQEATWAEEIDR